MLETLRELLGNLATYLIWAVRIFLVLTGGFVVGYCVAYMRYRKGGGTDPAGVETELGHLEGQMKLAENAVAVLLEKVRLRSQVKPWEIRVSEAPQGESGFQGLLNNISGFLSKSGNSQAESKDPFVRRLKDIKGKLKKITDNINYVRPFLNPDSSSMSRDGQSELESPADQRITSEEDDQGAESFISSGSLKSFQAEHEAKIIRHSSKDGSESSRDRCETSGSVSAGAARDIIELYNRAVTDSSAREQFREEYQPLRVGTVNAVERRQNPTIEAEFREATDGDFFAFKLHGNEYAVVPRLGLTIEAITYNAGALGQVFGHPTYDPKLFYSRYRVQRPAIFRCDGDRWMMRSPGNLDLGPGDS